MRFERLVVIADAHLAAPTGDGARDEASLVEFLHSVPEPGDAVLLAGDIYDFWFTWRHVIPRRNFAVTAALAELGRRVPVILMGGNHDRWGGSFWDSLPGVSFVADQIRLEAGGRSTLAIHGDGLHEHRGRDRLLNRLIRSRIAIGAYSLIPPGLAVPIGQALGHNSDAPPPERAEVAAARQAAWARNTLSANPDLGLLIMGHTHQAALEEVFPGRWYLNPGPWLREHRWALVSADTIELKLYD